MTITFRHAVRETTSTLTAFAGPSGGGKTYTALRYATGLADGGKIAVIDTEAGRALHYADSFDFDHADLIAPFTPDAYWEAIKAASDAGYKVIVIDSMSHEYEGQGGLLEWADDEAERGVKSPANWKKPKSAHKRMMGRLLQVRAHLIFCLRAEEKMLLTREGGQMKVIPAEQRPLLQRWEPICEKRFMYEMTASFLLLPDQPGVGRAIKLQDQHKPFFPGDKPISEESGKALAQWAAGGAQPQKPAQAPEEPAEAPLEDDGLSPSEQALRSYTAKFEACDTLDALKAAWAEAQPHAKAMTDEQFARLTAAKDERKAELADG